MKLRLVLVFKACRPVSNAESYCCRSFCFPGIHILEKDSITLGMVTNIQPQVGLLVKLPFGCMGTVAVTDLADAYKPNPLDGYSKDQLLRSEAAAATIS